MKKLFWITMFGLYFLLYYLAVFDFLEKGIYQYAEQKQHQLEMLEK